MFLMSAFTGLAFTDVSQLTDEHIVTDNDGNKWIRKPLLLLDEFAEITLHRFIPSPRYLHKVLADELMSLVVMFLYHLQDCALLFAYLSDTIESLLNNQRICFNCLSNKYMSELLHCVINLKTEDFDNEK